MKLKNKKAQVGSIIIFFGALFLILIFIFIGSLISSTVSYSSNIITPIFKDLGMVGSTNMSQVSQNTFEKVNIIVNSFPTIILIGAIGALLLSLVVIYFIDFESNPFLMGLYFAFMILLVFGSIIMSNMYQDIYNSGGDLSSQIHSQGGLNYLVLYSPFIFALISIIGGIMLFIHKEQGGYGV